MRKKSQWIQEDEPDKARRTIYYPYELKSREFEARIHFSVQAVTRGYTVIIGPRYDIYRLISKRRGAILIEKGISTRKLNKLKALRDQIYAIIQVCEESTAYPDAKSYMDRLLDREAIGIIKFICALGPKHAHDIVNHRPEAESKIKLTGNPRFDLLQEKYRTIYSKKVHQIHSMYGRFILINTNFPTPNPQKEHDNLAELESTRASEDQQAYRDFFQRFILQKKSQMQALKKLLEQIPREKRSKILIRPHPAESEHSWKEWAKSNGYKVVRKGSVVPWLIASEGLIHTGCTTAIEAVIVGRRVASFQPTIMEKNILPNQLGCKILDIEDLLSFEQIIFSDPDRLEDKGEDSQAEIARFISNYQGGSAESILQEIERIEIPRKYFSVEDSNILQYLRVQSYRSLRDALRELWRRFRLESASPSQTATYKEVRKLVSRFSKGDNGKDKVIRVEGIGADSWCLTAGK